MAFKHGLSERLDELRFPTPRSPPSESAFPGYTSLSPGHSNFGSGFSSRPAGDVRANLQRRFTTDSSKFSSWNYLNPSSGSASSSGSSQMQDPLDLLSSFEKKRQHIEYMREQKRRFEEDMKILDLQHAREKLEMDQLARDLAQAGISGPVSEPTTPPEYRDTAVSSAFSRPARFSTSSVTSSPGFFNAFAPSTLTSPQAVSQPLQHSIDRFAGHSVPGSRRNSEKDDFLADATSPFRSGPSAAHRYSLPSGNQNGHVHRSSISGLNGSRLDTFNVPKYLFPSDEDKSNGHLSELERLSTPDIKSYIKLTEPDDKFPTLSRRGDSVLSANPDAHDLANPRVSGAEIYSNHSRHRSSHQSMPQNIHNFGRLDQLGSQNNEDHANSANNTRHSARRSMGSQISFHDDRHEETATPVPSSRPTALQSSFSTNDLPTVKGNGPGNAITPPKTHNEHVHHHNASVGRIPQGSVNNHQSKTEYDENEFHGNQSTLHASAPPFGPQANSAASTNNVSGSHVQMGLPFGVPAVPAVPAFNYGIQPYVGQAAPINGHMQNFGPTAAYGAYPNYGPGFRFNEPTGRGNMAQRRQENEANQLTRFGNFPLEHYKGELYSLCKDQHGCRYLQRKLEERNPEHVQLIFSETYMHVIELMTDPFGNYLCQKLLEYSNDEQRTALIDNAAPQLVKIALNQHGTRALQKMIEFISTPQQTQTVINALQHHVVDLVQDLNGNHVIQKCLNRLTSEDAEFIYEAVGGNCVVVGTHRHGCCVLQRCIDHASGHQKARLIAQITSHSFALVQDPFGNYVVQYILDLAEPSFTNPLCATFGGNIPQLSKQKFSSNVIEKCLRTADNYMKREMIEEFLMGNELEKMLRDSFANYVVQTAMDFCDLETRNRIVEAVRPILPSIRQTPHGRRIAGKIMAADTNTRSNGSSTATSGQVTPNEMGNTAQIPKTLLQKPFMYQQPGVQSPTSTSGYSSQAYAPHSSQSSVSNTPSGQSDSSSVYTAPTQLSMKVGQQQIPNYF
ncbi:Armadillo-like helical [Penicillium paradoxum]|uniref:Armadillo-like helical n=1 Tax=Penicillium paradoxum TaxID=176176 RepID=UPI002546C00A|nr:Armadillo-like helical [Penicillium paradoxum]KAJ5787073.1 Armadillo-like helical [Penicillium paradoxum]